MMLPKQVRTAIERIQNAGYEAGVVGGCVRDSLMGRMPVDYDITTSALPEQIKAIFCDHTVIPTGEKHGTVTLLTDDMPLEITTYRLEGIYRDHRHPDSVAFTHDLEQDLARRDFTMNAIACDMKNGYTDPFGGREDIRNRIIRAVGEPEHRFREDALRILRAIRFSAVLGFEIEAKTKQAAFAVAPLLRDISPERVASELVKLLTGAYAGRTVREYIDIIGTVIPAALAMKNFDQKSRYHVYDVLTHTAMTVDNVPAEAGLRLAAFFHDIGKPACFSADEGGEGHFFGHAGISAEICDQTLKNLRFDNITRDRVVTLVKYHDYPFSPEERTVKHTLHKFGEQTVFDLLALQRGDTLAQAPEFSVRLEKMEQVKTVAQTVLRNEQCFSLKALAINGKDLIAAGMAPGPRIGQTLNRLLDAVIEGLVENDRDTLLEYMKKSE